MLERHTARIWMLRDDSLVTAQVASDIPRHVSGLLAPVLWQTSGLDGMRSQDERRASYTRTSVKGALKRMIDPVGPYRFMQWKGLGLGAHAHTGWFSPQPLTWGNGRSRPLSFRFALASTAPAPFPVFTAAVRWQSSEPWNPIYTRLYGGAPYEDLIAEAEYTRRCAQLTHGRLRTGHPIALYKWTQKGAHLLHAPRPEDDRCDSVLGESFAGYITRRRDEGDRVEDSCLRSNHNDHYQSAILGQNIRLFRCPWRFEDLELALFHPREPAHVHAIVADAMECLHWEFGTPMRYPEFCLTLAGILGRQAALLMTHGIVHGALYQHKQDVTLAGELTDFDHSVFLPEELRSGSDSWERRRLVQQLFLLANHLTVLLEAGVLLRESVSLMALATAFLDAFGEGVSHADLKTFLEYCEQHPDAATVDGMVGGDPQKMKNLDGFQPFFGALMVQLSVAAKTR